MATREEQRAKIYKQYKEEHAALGKEGTMRLLEEGEQWNLAPVLDSGGVLVFPHISVADCGHQVAAVVHACFNSGADKVLLISVLHAFTEELQDARVRVADGGNPSSESSWGIQGPGIEGQHQEWRKDHVLMSFHHLWKTELERRGGKGPEVVERYPYLAGGHPDKLPGIKELISIAKDAVIISTADSFHHGVGYGDPQEEALYPLDGGLELARSKIKEGIEILGRGDYWGYNQHCVEAKSDARDAGQVFRYLRGPMKGDILDLTYSDAVKLYDAPPPTWVAGALVTWELV